MSVEYYVVKCTDGFRICNDMYWVRDEECTGLIRKDPEKKHYEGYRFKREVGWVSHEDWEYIMRDKGVVVTKVSKKSAQATIKYNNLLMKMAK
jgi:hypothetical protein